ncbi:MAG TPA: formimidoylglutamate deiminase [Opitutaceae bacterium]|nr:formimidoylglutamate deiminase [Opitutaceae bacterium]
MDKKTSHAREQPAAPPAATPVKTIAPAETGWLPDCVYTGGKFEFGVAFFADALGRIARFSREPADLAAARRLAGQAALPGLVNAHSHAWQRVLRGRGELRPRAGADSLASWREEHDRVATRLGPEDVFEAARMAFLEMLLGGVTCVGEFHALHHQPDGARWPDANFLAREILRAAHEVGIRIALHRVAWAREGPARMLTPDADEFARATDELRAWTAKNFPEDDAWIGVGVQDLAVAPLDYFKAVASYAHARRMRLHAHVSTRAADNAACLAEHRRTPVALLTEHGIVDKRFTAIDAGHLTDDDVKLLGAARAMVGACPTSERNLGLAAAPVEKLLAAGVGVALGSDRQVQVDLLEDARLLEYPLRVAREQRAVLAPDPAPALLHAATVAGARSLGATGGALEVGRPADFFTVNLYEVSIAGAAPEALLNAIVFSLERRAVREVWIGARQRLANGRHPNQGAIVARFAEAQRRSGSE